MTRPRRVPPAARARRIARQQQTRLTVIQGDGRVVFRLVNDADLLDPWLSDYEAGRPPRRPQRASALIHMGLSMWSTQTGAEEANERVRIPYEAVAEVRLDGTKGIWFAKTFGDDHFTVWGRPRDLQQSISEVHSL